MEHVVFFPAADGSPAFRRVPSLDEAVRLVEHLRNVEGLSTVSVHALTEVPLAFRAYYRVEVPTAPPLPVVPAQAVAVEPRPAPAPAPAPVPAPAPAGLVLVEDLAADDPAVEPVREPAHDAPADHEREPEPLSAAPASLGFFA